jgi:hypothetical protein
MLSVVAQFLNFIVELFVPDLHIMDFVLLSSYFKFLRCGYLCILQFQIFLRVIFSTLCLNVIPLLSVLIFLYLKFVS